MLAQSCGTARCGEHGGDSFRASEAYNNFVETFGHVSSKANRAMIGEDVGAEAG